MNETKNQILDRFDKWWIDFSPPTSEDYVAAREAWLAATESAKPKRSTYSEGNDNA